MKNILFIIAFIFSVIILQSAQTAVVTAPANEKPANISKKELKKELKKAVKEYKKNGDIDIIVSFFLIAGFLAVLVGVVALLIGLIFTSVAAWMWIVLGSGVLSFLVGAVVGISTCTYH